MTNWIRLGLALAATLLVAAPAAAEDAPAADRLLGDWTGAYVCAQGLTGMTLRIDRVSPELHAYYVFYADPSNPGVPSGCYALAGSYDAESGAISLEPTGWIERPVGYSAVSLEGVLDSERRMISGAVLGFSCGSFEVASGPRNPLVDDLCYEPLVVSDVSPSRGLATER